MWVFQFWDSHWKKSYVEKSVVSIMDQREYYIVKGSRIQKIMKEKKNREQRDCVQKAIQEGGGGGGGGEEKCLSNMSREKNRCCSSMVYDN